MKSKVSVRGQTVIPAAIRKALGITPKTILYWHVEDEFVRIYPLPEHPVKASFGMLRGQGSFEEFMQMRREERAKELAAEQGP